MASVPYTRLTIGGTLQNVQEWSIGLSFVTATQPDDTELYAWLDSIHASVETWATKTASTGSAIWGPTVKYTRIGAYSYAAGSNRATHQASHATTTVTGGNSKDLPSQLAVVCSLLSGSPGRHNRGRVYVPFSASNALTGGQITPSTCDEIASNMADLINALGGVSIGGEPNTPSVVSSSPSGGHAALGTVGVDSVVDTQRRRRDKIIGVHYAAIPI